MMLYWATVFLVAFLWTFGIGLQTKAVARSHYLPAALMGVFLCGVQIFIVRAAVYQNPWLFFAVGGFAYRCSSSIIVMMTGRNCGRCTVTISQSRRSSTRWYSWRRRFRTPVL